MKKKLEHIAFYKNKAEFLKGLKDIKIRIKGVEVDYKIMRYKLAPGGYVIKLFKIN